MLTQFIFAHKSITTQKEKNWYAIPSPKWKTGLNARPHTLTKPREKSAEPSKAAKENIRLAGEVLKVMPEGEPVLTSWIMEHVNGIMTSQKCTKVMQVLISAGKVEKVEKVKGRYIGYKLV